MSLEFDMSSLNKKLSELEKRVSNNITKKALLESADIMEEYIVNETPFDTHELQKNTKSSKKIKIKKGVPTIDVGVTSDDRKIVERAYYQHYGTKRYAPTYYMDIGFEKGLEPSKKKMIDIIKKELKND